MGLSYFTWIPCDKAFLSVQKLLTLWPRPWSLTFFWKTLTWAITFEPDEMGLSYFACVLLVTIHVLFTLCHNFWPLDLGSLMYFSQPLIDDCYFLMVAFVVFLTTLVELQNEIQGESRFWPVCDSVICLSVTLWPNFNRGDRFWTIRDEDFKFYMHTLFMKLFQMTTCDWSMVLSPWSWP